jgi:hypothetical protein
MTCRSAMSCRHLLCTLPINFVIRGLATDVPLRGGVYIISLGGVLRELDTPPLDHIWWSRAVRFWESVRRLAPDNIYYQVLQDNCRDAIARGVRNWAKSFLTGLRRIGYPRTTRCDTLISVDPPTVQSLLADQSNTVWQGLSISPRTCPSRGAQLCTYLRWFARPSLLPPRFSALRLPIGVRRLRIFLRFRMGCHGLPVDVGGAQGYLARSVYAPGVFCRRWGTSVTSYSRARR